MEVKAHDLVVKNILEADLYHFLSILKEASLWLKTEDHAMWNEEDFTTESVLKNYSIHEIYLGYIGKNMPVATMVLQQEDPIFWSNYNENDSLFLHKLAIRRTYSKTGISSEMINWAKLYEKTLVSAT